WRWRSCGGSCRRLRCGRRRRGAGTRTRRAGCWRSRWCWTGIRGRTRPRAAAWTGRPCATGCTATTPRGSPGSRTAALPAPRRGSRPSRRPRWTVGSSRGRSWSATAWCAGAAATCGSGSGASSGWACTSARSASCWPSSASAACRSARTTPRATRPRKRLSRGLRGVG
ncbi:MAG: Mobile element protein, partial [uncultured Acetobacteraceae bacterium]